MAWPQADAAAIKAAWIAFNRSLGPWARRYYPYRMAVTMLLVIARDLGGIVDILLRAPLLGTVLFALASTFWLVVVRGVYRRRDGQGNLKGWSSLFLGFTVAMVAGLYVSAYQDSLPPAALLCFATLAAFSPTLLYLLYRGLKPSR